MRLADNLNDITKKNVGERKWEKEEETEWIKWNGKASLQGKVQWKSRKGENLMDLIIIRFVRSLSHEP